MVASEIFILKDHADEDIQSKVIYYQFEDTLTEEIPSLILRVAAKRGKYLITAPKFAHFERIFARLTDKNGDTVEDVFEILKIKPMEHPNQGKVIELICSHQSWYVWQDHFSKQYQRQSGFEVTADIFASYNFSAGTSQPQIRNPTDVFVPATGLGNKMRKSTFNDYDFGNTEIKDWDGVLEVIDRLGAPISAKGEFEFYEGRLRSAYNHSTGLNLDEVDVSIFPSGFKNGALITIDKDDLLNRVYDVEGNLEAESGFVIGVWAESDAGTLPTSVAQYFSEKEEFNTAKAWVSGIEYQIGSRVIFTNGNFYTSTSEHTSSGTNEPTDVGAPWSVDTFTPSIDYSIATKNQAQYWINAGLGPKHSGTVNGRAAIFDANAIIRDDNHRRTICHFVTTNPTNIPTEDLKSGVVPRGYKVLCNGVGAGAFTGNDSVGKAFTNNWIQWTGTEWLVFVETIDEFEVVDKHESKAWTRKAGVWTWGAPNPITGIFIAQADFDCMHRYTVLSLNNPDFGNTQGIEDGTPGANSAVRIKFDYTNPLRSENDKRYFCGINFAFPFPPNSNAIPWGAVGLGDIFLPDTLDTNNMHLSSKDERGFVQGLDAKLRGAEDFGPLSAFRSWLFFRLKNALGSDILEGDFNWRFFLFDTSDNVIKIDRTHPHNNNVEEITFELNGHEIYRARGVTAFIPVKELEVLNRFEWRNCQFGGVYISDYYDKEGRFQGPFSRIAAISTISLGTQSGSAEMYIDAPHWVKPLLSISHKSETRPARNLQPRFKNHQQVFNKVQSDNIADAWKEFHAFKKVEYTIRTVFRCDIKAGEWFYFTHSKLIDTTTDAKNNTEKLVSKKIIYTRTKGKGEGGRKRFIVGSKRFVA